MDKPSNVHVFAAAKVVIHQHGDAAAYYASGRADELLELGDIEGAKVWRRIKKAIEELLILTPKGPVH